MTRNQGLPERQRETLAKLERKKRLTDIEVGALHAARYFGNAEESARAERRLAKHQTTRKRAADILEQLNKEK